MRRRLIIPFILAAIFISACSAIGEGLRVPQSPLLAALERKSGLIAYLGLDGNLYTIDQGGGKETMVTEDAHAEQDGVRRFYDFPTWSVEDNKLAFVGFEVNANGETSASIFATGKRAADPQEIYNSNAHVPFYLYWSPNGEYVSFLSSSRGTTSMAMQIAPAEGGASSVLDTGRPYYWAWSPESMEVMAHVGGSAASNPGGARLSLLEVDPIVREIGLGIEPTNFQAPVYSPDGDYVLIAGESAGGLQQLILADSAGRLQNPITEYEGNIAFDWAPKGNYAAYLTSNVTSQALVGNLTFLDLRRPTEPEIIETEAEDVMGFFWAPDGKKLAYFVPLIISEAEDGEQQTSENTRFLLELYVVEPGRGGHDRIAAFEPTPTFLNLFPFFDQYQRSATIWSPDSNNLVISAVSGGSQQGLFIVPASGDFEPRFLTQGRVAFWSWE